MAPHKWVMAQGLPREEEMNQSISYTTANTCLEIKNRVLSLCATLKSKLSLGYVTSHKGTEHDLSYLNSEEFCGREQEPYDNILLKEAVN